MIKKPNNNAILYRYAGLATQFIVSIGLALYIGFKLDIWLTISLPVFIWLLPLMVIIITIWKILKDTSKK